MDDEPYIGDIINDMYDVSEIIVNLHNRIVKRDDYLSDMAGEYLLKMEVEKSLSKIEKELERIISDMKILMDKDA